MGMEVALAVVAGVQVASTVAKADAQQAAAEAAEKSLDLQAKQQELQYQQKTLQNLSAVEKVLDAQTAMMTTRGVAFSSPSFNAIRRNTINVSSRQQANLDIEEDIAQQNIKIEKQNVKDTLYAQLFGDVAEAGQAAFSMYSSTPRLPGA